MGKPVCGVSLAPRFEKQYITEMKKFGGGSVMVWACFSYYGVGQLTFIDGIMDAQGYVSILSFSLESTDLSEFIF